MNLGRILFTLLCFGSFIIIFLFTYRRGAKKGYDEVARDVIDDDDSTEGLSDVNNPDSSTHGNGANK